MAEILISLLIITVVATIVIPIIINDTGQKELEVKNSILRSIVVAAHQKIYLDHHGNIHDTKYGSDLANELKLLKNCNTNPEVNGCWHAPGVAKILKSDGSSRPMDTSSYSNGFVTLSGMMFRINNDKINCNDRTINSSNTFACNKATHYYKGYCTEFSIDLNGRHGPNIFGQDIRYIEVFNDKVYMYGDSRPDKWERVRNYDVYTESDFASGGVCYDGSIYTHTQY